MNCCLPIATETCTCAPAPTPTISGPTPTVDCSPNATLWCDGNTGNQCHITTYGDGSTPDCSLPSFGCSPDPVDCPLVMGPTISLDPTQFSFSATVNGSPVTGLNGDNYVGNTMTITNTGNQDLNWEGITDSAWCHVSPALGFASPGNSSSVTITVDPMSTSGTYYCTVTITDPNATNNPGQAFVTYTVNAPPCDPRSVGTNQFTGCQFPTTGGNPPGVSYSAIGYAPAEPGVASPADNVTPLPDNKVLSGLNGYYNYYDLLWKGKFNFTGGTYKFTWGSDDGIRAFIDNNNDGLPDGNSYLINNWYDQAYPGSPFAQNVAIPAGQQQIDVEYYQDMGQAEYSLSWALLAVVAPSISLAPSSFTFNGVSGGATPSGQTMTISDPVAGTTLNWAAAPTGAGTWCHVSPTSGTAPNGSPSTVTITVDAPSTVGSFNNCGILVSDNGSSPAASNSPQVANVTYNVSLADTCTGAGCGTCSGGVCGGNPGGTPSNSVAATASCTAIALSWQASSGATSYNIYRANTNSYPGGAAYATSATNSYTDTTSGGPYFYWVQAANASGNSPDVVAANTNTAAPPGISVNVCGGVGPTTVSIDNSTCGQITVTWSAVGGATGYNIYRNTTNSIPGSPIAGSPFAPQNGNTGNQTYVDTTSPSLYYYWVSAIVGGVETTKVAPNSGPSNPIQLNACASPNVLVSDKDIIAVNGSKVIYPGNSGNDPIACNHATDALPSSISLKYGDILTFRINICNGSGTGPLSGISVTDNLINLKQAGGSWGGQYCTSSDNSVCSSPANFPTVAGSPPPPNQQLTFAVPGIIAAGGGTHILFNAQLTTPPGFTGSSARFQNSFCINYTGGGPVCSNTPLLPFSINGGVPIINEIP
jgi:hypothetical protein